MPIRTLTKLLGGAVARIRKEPKAPRFLASRLFWTSRLCEVLPLRARLADGSTVRFRAAAMAANLWVDPSRYDGKDIAFLRQFLRPGDTFVDIGANVGVYTLYAARIVGSTGRVVAVEAHPKTFKYLEENVRANGYPWVECVLAAVTDHCGTVGFTDIRSDDQNRVDPSGPIQVPGLTLDQLLPNGPVRLLKVDVEGHEAALMAGAVDVVSRSEAVLIEAWRPARQQVNAALKDFEINILTDRGDLANLLAIRAS